jgi:hypothetical protein
MAGNEAVEDQVAIRIISVIAEVYVHGVLEIP